MSYYRNMSFLTMSHKDSRLSERLYTFIRSIQCWENNSCSYADLALASCDSKALTFDLSPTMWKRFRDDMFVVWTHGPASVSLF